MMRTVQDEMLDHLAQDDPRAVHSRRDLRRIHRMMGTRSILLKALRTLPFRPRRILEIGAGDGTLMLALARKLHLAWPDVHLKLLDRQPVASAQTLQAFRALGWQADSVATDIFEWANDPGRQSHDLIVANLFLHHFDDGQLSELMPALLERSRALCVCEPRRGKFPLLASRLVGLIGANEVTRQDAVLSVHAGFAGQELSHFMAPQAAGQWQWRESSAGWFSHCLFAVRNDAGAFNEYPAHLDSRI